VFYVTRCHVRIILNLGHGRQAGAPRRLGYLLRLRYCFPTRVCLVGADSELGVQPVGGTGLGVIIRREWWRDSGGGCCVFIVI
jgi:hypothetical protein